MIRAGEFEIHVTEPYPVNIGLWYKEEQIACFEHSELADLAFVIKIAQHSARAKLKQDKDEVVL